ncbi:hypothetical protein FZEAL_2403 [Fusarium zealandicum]|uniref:Uncharacterized protein n=1 Tax=Fusarium zealandicum TaxID=1053134 RepID=A0A8H4URI2_9HYPO|nr:hypothetical protein FZEAL_2403 [Fusarium zealandicum]
MSKTPAGLDGSIWANGRPRLSTPMASSRTSSHSPVRQPPPLKRASSSAPIESRPTASAPPTSIPASLTRLTPTQAFHRFEQACQRLRWKFLDLQSSYQRATHPEEFGFAKADAERNFKVDFHEFYVWIEQAIVLLLLIFGVSVSRVPGGPVSNTVSNSMVNSRGNAGKGYYIAAGHAYHHNVIKALEDEACPVYEALGKGEVNQALWKAKELRNRWKDAGEGKETPPLQMYDLTWIVTQVLGGLELGYGIAARHVELEMVRQQQYGDDIPDETMGGGDEDEWEWMVEPMDWEAA